MSHSCLDNTTGKACRVLQPLRLKLALVTCLTLVAGLIADCGPGQLWGPGEAWGQVPSRPSAPELLPQETVAYVQIPNIQRLKENFAETGFGQMLADDRVAPLVEQVYEELSYLYTDYVEETVGVKLDELLTLPAGEICFAVVAPRRDTPNFVMLLAIQEDREINPELLRLRGRGLPPVLPVGVDHEEEEPVPLVPVAQVPVGLKVLAHDRAADAVPHQDDPFQVGGIVKLVRVAEVIEQPEILDRLGLQGHTDSVGPRGRGVGRPKRRAAALEIEGRGYGHNDQRNDQSFLHPINPLQLLKGDIRDCQS